MTFYSKNFDIIVVGGGHAGTEAASAAARMGAKTLLLTHNIDTLGQMSCNPAIGGIGKGHLVKEIDALGGIMAKAIDKSGIQFRVLNSRKGPAVRATRAQADRKLYKNAICSFLEKQKNLSILQQSVDDLLIKNNCILGVVTQIGLKLCAKATILTVGTFLSGKIHIGNSQCQGGRSGDQVSTALAQKFHALPHFKLGRLKTGTPPRIDRRTVDYSKMSIQLGDNPKPRFSFFTRTQETKQVNQLQEPCYITYTNPKTHEIIFNNFSRSPIKNAMLSSLGPRYCPSIEDKIIRFSNKERHQIFVEPEGIDAIEIYPNGISTSMPFDVQLQFVQSIEGFENAWITRPGYAIEYDFFDPRGLDANLETKQIENLFFAGQINGTTGYEEAAAQGIIAGINAALKLQGKPTWSPKRSEAYIGVLIDDLITKGAQEPYRMFTSRAEHRLLLREDNADMRLCPEAIKLGLLNKEDELSFTKKRDLLTIEMLRLKSTSFPLNSDAANKLHSLSGVRINKESSLFDLLKRPDLDYKHLSKVLKSNTFTTNPQIIKQIEISAKYEGYIKRQNQEILENQKLDNIKIPKNFNYDSLPCLSNEVRQKLISYRPSSLGQASRIQGITPAAISLLTIYMKKLGLLCNK